ncbi:MAG: hypothetical protein OTI34_12100 [Lewinella sp.]|jgi:hypothetical protein|nr:hypothetical protein [Lewinella sp.]
MNKFFYATAFALVVILLSSCGGLRAALPDDRSGEVVSQPFSISSLEIVDDRGALRPLGWKLPMLAVRARTWTGDPVLGESHRSDINRIVKASQDPTGIPAEFKFTLRQGELMLYADAMIAREHVKMKGELSIFIPGRDFKLYLTSSLDYEIPTYNATEKHARQVYDIAIRNLCLEMVKQIQEEMGTGGAKS